MSQEKTEEKEKPKQTLAWKCLCDQCENRDKCLDLLRKSGALKKLGIRSPDEVGEKLAIAVLSFIAGVATDEILRSLLSGRQRRKRFFDRVV